MAKRNTKSKKRERRTFRKEFKQEAVQMLLDGHSASSVSKNLGIGNTNLLYRWKAELVSEGGPVPGVPCLRDLECLIQAYFRKHAHATLTTALFVA